MIKAIYYEGQKYISVALNDPKDYVGKVIRAIKGKSLCFESYSISNKPNLWAFENEKSIFEVTGYGKSKYGNSNEIFLHAKPLTRFTTNPMFNWDEYEYDVDFIPNTVEVVNIGGVIPNLFAILRNAIFYRKVAI